MNFVRPKIMWRRTRFFFSPPCSLWLLCFAFYGCAHVDSSSKDPWFAGDKALHFAASASLASAGYALASTQYERREPRFLWGGGVALLAGVGKECLDALGLGDPSFKDLTWDLIGMALGLGFAFGMDMALSKPSSPAPSSSQKRVLLP